MGSEEEPSENPSEPYGPPVPQPYGPFVPEVEGKTIEELWYGVRNAGDEAISGMGSQWGNLETSYLLLASTLRTRYEELSGRWRGDAAVAYRRKLEDTIASLDAAATVAGANRATLYRLADHIGQVQTELEPVWNEYQTTYGDEYNQIQREASQGGVTGAIGRVVRSGLRKVDLMDTPDLESIKEEYTRRARDIVRPLEFELDAAQVRALPEFAGPEGLNIAAALPPMAAPGGRPGGPPVPGAGAPPVGAPPVTVPAVPPKPGNGGARPPAPAAPPVTGAPAVPAPAVPAVPGPPASPVPAVPPVPLVPPAPAVPAAPAAATVPAALPAVPVPAGGAAPELVLAPPATRNGQPVGTPATAVPRPAAGGLTPPAGSRAPVIGRPTTAASASAPSVRPPTIAAPRQAAAPHPPLPPGAGRRAANPPAATGRRGTPGVPPGGRARPAERGPEGPAGHPAALSEELGTLGASTVVPNLAGGRTAPTPADMPGAPAAAPFPPTPPPALGRAAPGRAAARGGAARTDPAAPRSAPGGDELWSRGGPIRPDLIRRAPQPAGQPTGPTPALAGTRRPPADRTLPAPVARPRPAGGNGARSRDDGLWEVPEDAVAPVTAAPPPVDRPATTGAPAVAGSRAPAPG